MIPPSVDRRDQQIFRSARVRATAVDVDPHFCRKTGIAFSDFLQEGEKRVIVTPRIAAIDQ